jgi:hypothetical protein
LVARGQDPSLDAPEPCRPDPVSPRALARRRDRAWRRHELRAALALIDRQLPRDVVLWAGKAGATRYRILDALRGLAQERQSLEVEETLERLAAQVGLQSAGTVWERIHELEAAGWLVRLTTGRKGHYGTTWRIEVPARLRAASSRQADVLFRNRDIKKDTSDPGLLASRVVQETSKPRLTALSQPIQLTPNPKSAAKEELPAPSRSTAPGSALLNTLYKITTHLNALDDITPSISTSQPHNNSRTTPRRTWPPRSQPIQAPVGSGVDLQLGSVPQVRPVWPPAAYGAMRTAVECAARGSAAPFTPRFATQVKVVTRALLAGEFRPADVGAAVGRVGPCAPLRLRAILEGGHIDLPPRPAPELAAGPGRELLLALVAALPDVDTDTRPRSQVRDREREERDEALSWEAERARQLAALMREPGWRR